MPDGATHYKYWKSGWVVTLPASVSVSIVTNPVLGAGIFTGYLFGRWVSPDWDLMSTSEDEGRVVNEIPIIGFILYGISSVYGAIFRKYHRSFITHFPGISTIIRLFFIFWWLLLLYYFNVFSYAEWQRYLLVGVVIGLSFSDAIHWFADMFHSLFHHKRRKKY